tara:strand:+ start:253 stop:657 length:405 start_codon:yes stop_codon:yes gene_type:complete
LSNKPRISVKLQDGQLLPCSAYDAEQLALATHNAEFDLVLRSKRSEQHHKLYWSILGKACQATGKWPNSDNLHRELKMACGFFQTVVSEFGGIYYFPDTIAMNKMNQKEFNEFFELAMEKLADAIGTDPLELLK